MMLPNKRDCKHGAQLGKCLICELTKDLAELRKEICEVKAERAALQKQLARAANEMLYLRIELGEVADSRDAATNRMMKARE